jgi:HEAT repeat protein
MILPSQSLNNRYVSCVGCGFLGKRASKLLPDLVKAMRAQGKGNTEMASSVRRAAIFAVGKMGTDAAPAMATLIAIASDPNERADERFRAVAAISAIGISNPEIVEALRRAARSSDAAVQGAAMEALERLK